MKHYMKLSGIPFDPVLKYTVPIMFPNTIGLPIVHDVAIYPGGRTFVRGSMEHRARNRAMVERGEFVELYPAFARSHYEGYTGELWYRPPGLESPTGQAPEVI